jgi:hypothetical protein
VVSPMRSVLPLALVLTACADPDVSVRIRYLQPEVAPEVVEFTEAGGMAWDAAGVPLVPYDASDADDYGNSTHECPHLWWATEHAPCVVTVQVTYTPLSELGGAWGVAYPHNRHVTIGYELQRFDLMTTAAHEVGHVLYDRTEHIEDGDQGVMHASDQGYTSLQAADLDWAELAMEVTTEEPLAGGS